MQFWAPKHILSMDTGEQQLPLHMLSSRILRENEATP